MSTVKTNNMQFSICEESAFGTAAAPWTQIEVNDVSEWGRQNETAARNPISKSRQRQGGEIVRFTSGFAFTADLTMHHLLLIIGAALRCKPTGAGPLTDAAYFRPTAVTGTGYTVAADGDLAEGTLIYASGFSNEANNGFKVVTAGSTGTEIHASGLVAELNTGGAAGSANDAKNATVAVCGFQAATADLVINASGNLESTALDLSALGLSVGQWFCIGGDTAVTQFATAGNNGLRRITSIAADEIAFDKSLTAPVADTGTGKTIQLFFGTFFRNYDTDHATYDEPSFSAEGTYKDLGGVGTPNYQYPNGNVSDETVLSLPLAGLASIQQKYVGADTPAFTAVRATGADNARRPVLKSAMNTSSRIVRVRATEYDETALTSYLEDATLTIRNGSTPKNVLGQEAAIAILDDNCEVSLATTIVLTDPEIEAAARDYDKVTTEFILHNADGGAVFDLPAVRIGSSAQQLRRGDAVGLQATFEAEQDTTFGFSLGVSIFPYLPETLTE